MALGEGKVAMIDVVAELNGVNPFRIPGIAAAAQVEVRIGIQKRPVQEKQSDY
jgi:hypothetical protein